MTPSIRLSHVDPTVLAARGYGKLDQSGPLPDGLRRVWTVRVKPLQIPRFGYERADGWGPGWTRFQPVSFAGRKPRRKISLAGEA